jgi:hypothetical protein
MLLYFAGAESPSHLNTLRSEGVLRVAVNVTALSRRVKDLSDWATEERLGGLDWVLYADSPETPWEDALLVLNSAMQNGVPPEAVIGPAAWGSDTWLGDSDLFFSPTWDGVDNGALRECLERYNSVFLPDSVVENAQACRTAQAAVGNGQVLGALTGRSKGLENYTVVISPAWWAVQKHGETQVWDHGKFFRYNSKDKLAKRQQHRSAIESLGVDFDAVLADDAAALARLAIRSWVMLERETPARKAVPVAPTEEVEVGNPQFSKPLEDGSGVRRLDSDRISGRHAVLPVIGLELAQVESKDMDGTVSTTEVETLAVTQESLRRCDTCSFSLQCPSYEAGAKCAYHIPVIIRSKDQLQGVLRAMVEVQTQRVLMQRFGEEITGTPDPDVGREMDRLFNMVEKWKDIEDNRDTLEVSVKAKGQMGMLSRLFGSKVGSNAMVLDSPIPSDTVMGKMTSDD